MKIIIIIFFVLVSVEPIFAQQKKDDKKPTTPKEVQQQEREYTGSSSYDMDENETDGASNDSTPTKSTGSYFNNDFGTGVGIGNHGAYGDSSNEMAPSERDVRNRRENVVRDSVLSERNTRRKK